VDGQVETQVVIRVLELEGVQEILAAHRSATGSTGYPGRSVR